MKFWDVVRSFFKIGVIGFGSGNALVPIIEKECVETKQYITKNKFEEEFVIQSLTPGSLPIKMGVSVGMRRSPLCAAASSYASTLMGAFLMLASVILIAYSGDAFLTQLSFFSFGISVFVIFLIFVFTGRVFSQARSLHFIPSAIFLFVFAVVFTINTKFAALTGDLGGTAVNLNLPELKSYSLLLIGLAIITFTKLKIERTFDCLVRWLLTAIVVTLFLLSTPSNAVLPNFALRIVSYVLVAVMIVFAVCEEVFITHRAHKVYPKIVIEHKKSSLRPRVPLITIAIMLVLPAIFITVLALLPVAGADLWGFVSKSVLSTVTTFGGGTVFLSVGEDLFVGSGMIASEIYWVQIAPLGNMFPGSLLAKMLPGIGFYYIQGIGGSMGMSVLYGVTGFVIGVSATVIAHLLIYMVFRKMRHMDVFSKVKQGISPLIAGLLMPTVLSMLSSMVTSARSSGFGLAVSLPFAAILMVGAVAAGKKKAKYASMILFMGLFSLGFFNVYQSIVGT